MEPHMVTTIAVYGALGAIILLAIVFQYRFKTLFDRVDTTQRIVSDYQEAIRGTNKGRETASRLNTLDSNLNRITDDLSYERDENERLNREYRSMRTAYNNLVDTLAESKVEGLEIDTKLKLSELEYTSPYSPGHDGFEPYPPRYEGGAYGHPSESRIPYYRPPASSYEPPADPRHRVYSHVPPREPRSLPEYRPRDSRGSYPHPREARDPRDPRSPPDHRPYAPPSPYVPPGSYGAGGPRDPRAPSDPYAHHGLRDPHGPRDPSTVVHDPRDSRHESRGHSVPQEEFMA